MPVDIWAYGYAFVVALGGVIGYMKAGSVASLMAGLIFGGLACIGAYQTSHDPSNYCLSLGVAGVLAGLMGFRFAKSSKIMPAGLVAALSIGMCCRILCRAFAPSSTPEVPLQKD
ncbi:transmembrane protein 14C-like [Haemaphysalis longicornis]